MTTKIRTNLVVILILIVLTVSSYQIRPVKSAKTWTVDANGSADFTTIQQAVDASASGDSIIVKAGKYSETVNIDKSLTLSGENQLSFVSGFIIGSDDTAVISVSGFTITLNGIGIHGGNILTINNNHIFNCSYAIMIDGYHGSFNEIDIINNQIDGNGRGISGSYDAGIIKIDNNVLVNNDAAITEFYECKPEITNNKIYSNKIGITVSDPNEPAYINHNHIWRNEEGIVFPKGSEPLIYGATIINNVVEENQVGILASICQSTVDVHQNSFIKNTVQIDTQGTIVDYQFSQAYPVGGNYWSDYKGIDVYKGSAQNVPGSDGIGDTPYPISTAEKDQYPLMTPISNNWHSSIGLSSAEDASTTSNLGTIVLNAQQYTPGATSQITNWAYTLSYAPQAGYIFHNWVTTGGASVSSTTANPTTLSVSSVGTVKAVYTKTIFDDTFETNNFSKWTGYYLSTGETRSISTAIKHHGTYSAKFTSNGGGGNEYAYVYKTITATNDLYVRGYFYLSQSGLVQDGAKQYLLDILSGTNGIVFAGWARTGGVNKWVLVTRNNGVAVFTYSASSPSLSKWYCVEIHFKGDSVNGVGELFVDGVKVCSITGKNTANYGSANRVQCGFSYLYNCASSTVYMDDITVAKSYIGSEFTLNKILTLQIQGSGTTTPAAGALTYPTGTSVSILATPASGWKLDHWILDGVNAGGSNPYIFTMDIDHSLTAVFTQVIMFSDGFESGSFSQWTATRLSTGETAIVSNSRPRFGTYSARFASNGGGGSEYSSCYKTISTSQNVYLRGYFYVSQSGIVDNNGRFYLSGIYNTDTWVALAGWRRDSGGVLRWALIMNNGNTGVVQYSSTTPTLNTWYSVELHWFKAAVGGHGELYVDGVKICSITNIDTSYKGDANRVQVGLPIITSCSLTTAYADNIVVSSNYIGP